MGYGVILLFFCTALLSLVEKYLGKYKLPIYFFIGVVLILMAGLREVGIDPDSETYEYNYHNYTSTKLLDGIEYSFIVISGILHNISNDVHILFLFYAFWGVILKLFAIRQLSELLFLPLLVYISFYYELHEMTQIRTGLLSGIFLLSIKPLAEGKKWRYCLLILLGSLFHISALILLPLVFLSNKAITFKQSFLWISLIPVGYCFYFLSNSILVNLDIPYIGAKLISYQNDADKVVSAVNINVLSPKHLFTILIFVYLLYFRDTILEKNIYFPLMIKIFAIGIVSLTIFGFLPTLAQRVSYLFEIVSIIVTANIYYTIRPRCAGILAVVFISFINLNYALPYISFNLLWKGG